MRRYSITFFWDDLRRLIICEKDVRTLFSLCGPLSCSGLLWPPVHHQPTNIQYVCNDASLLLVLFLSKLFKKANQHLRTLYASIYETTTD